MAQKAHTASFTQFAKDKRNPTQYEKSDLESHYLTDWSRVLMEIGTQWYGPLNVVDVKLDDYGQQTAVRLQMPHHDWFSFNKIKQYYPPKVVKWPALTKPPPPDSVMVEGQREFVVEQILGHRPAKCRKGALGRTRPD